MLTSTISFPIRHSSGPITAVVSPAAASFRAAVTDTVVEARQQAGRPAHAKTAEPAAAQQEEGDDR